MANTTSHDVSKRVCDGYGKSGLTHAEVAGTSVECGGAEDEAEDCDSFRGCDVPCSLVVLSGVVRPPDGDGTGDEVWRAD